MFLYYFSTSCFKEFFMGHGVSGRCGQVVLNSSDIVSLPFVLLYIKIFLSLLSKKKKKKEDAVHFTWLTYKILDTTWKKCHIRRDHNIEIESSKLEMLVKNIVL